MCCSVDTSRRRRVVQHEDPGIGDERAGDGDALSLTAGEGQAALADARLVAVRQAAMNSSAWALRAALSICSSVASGRA